MMDQTSLLKEPSVAVSDAVVASFQVKHSLEMIDLKSPRSLTDAVVC